MVLFGIIRTKIRSSWVVDGTFDKSLPLGLKFVDNTLQLKLYQTQPYGCEPYVTIVNTWSYANAIVECLLQENDDVDLRLQIVSYSEDEGIYMIHINVEVKESCLEDSYILDKNRPLIFDRLFHHNAKHAIQYSIDDFNQVGNSCVAYDVDAPDNDYGIAKLLPYQREDIRWALDLETYVSKNVKERVFSITERNVRYSIPNSDQHILFTNMSCYRFPGAHNTTDQLFWKGGILCHDVGMGKTLIIIGMIIATVRTKKLNLVVCPRRLIKQWTNEIEENSKIRVVPIMSITQYRKACRLGILSSPEKTTIVVMGYNFFTNTKYTEEVNLPRIHDIDWDRIVLDEGHEILRDHFRTNESSRIEVELMKLKQTRAHRWICSATPYNSIVSFAHVSNFLQKANNFSFYYDAVNTEQEISIEKINHKFNHSIQKIMPKYIRKRREGYATIPRPIFRDILLDMSSIEETMYRTCVDDHERVMFCTHILVSDFHNRIMGGEAISMLELKEKYATKFLKMKKLCLTRINNITNRLSENLSVSDRSKLKESMNLVQKHLQEIESRSKIFDKIDERIRDNEICPICLDAWGDKVTVVTHCGHFVCRGCCDGIMTTSKKCPMCREPMTKDNITLLRNKTDSIERSDVEEDGLRKHGVKMSFLIREIQRIVAADDDNRIIVFSTWDVMLRLIKETLTEVGINHISINGTAAHIASKVLKFKTDASLKVVMMSSDKASSGLNLIEATHIILLDSVNAINSDFVTLEKQAIGRAVRLGQTKRVEVIRTIVRDTIEETNYNNLVSTRKIVQES